MSQATEEYKRTVARAERAEAKCAELTKALKFVERWAVHHGGKESVSAESALSVIQHYPPIAEITAGYADGKTPETFNPFAKCAELQAELDAIRALEPVYAFRRKGLDDFCTCTEARFHELSEKKNLFEVMKFYALPEKK